MARVIAITGRNILSIDAGWAFARAPAGAYDAPPRDLDLQWRAAIVPGTAAASLEAQGLWRLADVEPFDGDDFWYRTRLKASGPRVLRFHGLATIAEIWIDDARVLVSDNMFLRHDVPIELHGEAELTICFRSLASRLAAPLKRARWRSRLVQPPAMRGVRSSLIGHMPSWCPPVPILGPWRPIELIEQTEVDVVSCDTRTSLMGSTGIVDVSLVFSGGVPAGLELTCAGKGSRFSVDGSNAVARLEIPDVALWWPHTHGKPTLHGLMAHAGGITIDLGRVGFRLVELDRGADGNGFGLRVNGVDIFCRGSVWTSADIVKAPCTRDGYAPLLAMMREAGMNMARVGGTFAYEAPVFFDLCDELGILVWQDFMFANLDYPFEDPTFAASAEAEAVRFLDDTQASPSLVVLSGGSEIFQQAAMMGATTKSLANNWFETSLAKIVARTRPDAIFLPNTPCGGGLPFQPDSGVSHYYGVSAYKRPLDDARRANVRFAAECLGFANVPEALPIAFEDGAPRLAQPCWNERAPFDAGAIWFFEDVRNHYIHELYGISAEAALAQGAERYLALSRAVNAELMEAVFAEFRRAGSPTRGGLTWFLKDVWPGAGWGLIDHAGSPKSVWFALKRAFRSVQVVFSDEGLNGLVVHVINEAPVARDVTLALFCLADGATPVMRAEIALSLAPRETRAIAANEIWGAFFDTNYAYRFGPPSHDVTIGMLSDATDGKVIAQAFHFPGGRGEARHDLGLAAQIYASSDGYELELSCERFAQSVQVIDANYRCDDNWFHLAPNIPRRVRLTPRKSSAKEPRGTVAALNGLRVAHYGGAP